MGQVGGSSLVVRALAAAAAGALVSVLVAPWWIPWLHWGAYLPIFWALREDTPRQNRWLLLLYGTVAEALIFSWIAETITLFSNIPAVGAWAINLLFAVVFGLPYLFGFVALHPLRRRLGAGWILALPAWVVLVEYISQRWILFPYNQGVSQYLTPSVWQLTSVTGIWGMSFLMVGFNAALGEAIYRRREGRPFPVAIVASAVAIVLAVTAWGSWRYAAVEAELAAAPVVRILQVQDDATMTERMSGPRARAFQFWVDQTLKLPRGAADLVVWPEGSVPYQLNEGSVAASLWKLAIEGEFDLIVGAGTREREADTEAGEEGKQRIFNSVYFFQRARLQSHGSGTPDGDWSALVQGGCDLDGQGIVLPFLAGQLASAGERAGNAPDCVARLREREASLRGAMRVDPTFEAMLLADPTAWGRLRYEGLRFAGRGPAPLREAAYGRAKTDAVWRLAEAGCDDGDCLTVTVVCADAGGCFVVPEAIHYDKMVPLPFGEYLPLAETFPWLADLIEGPGNFRAGTEALVVDTAGARISTPICYEAILGYVCTAYDRPDLFVNVTNDAWFGDTAASHLHGMLVTVRAIELGIPVFRSAYSGVSFVVEPHGRLYAETPLFQTENRVVEVRKATVSTIYARFGDWFVAVCAVGLGAAWFLAGRSGR